jgi:hypothetical protein
MMNTGNAKESRQMSIVLEKLKTAVKQGQADRSIQRVPHFVVLRKQFYTVHLLPLLAEWLLIWLGTKGLSGLTDHQVLEFLKKGPRDAAAAKAVEQATGLNAEYVKMLNLSHDWLTSYLPHVLTKIHRVGFGILSWGEIEEIKSREPYLPKSRMYTAVPFVGKDVPSKASEFSHADVVIGLTILAYRYGGLRAEDFRSLLQNLREEMQHQYGPYNKRPASERFEVWIKAAGGRVRGSKFEKESEESDRMKKKRQEKERKKAEDAMKKQELQALFGSSSSGGMDLLSPSSGGPEDDGAFGAYVSPLGEDMLDIWPLRLIDCNDEDQFAILFKLLRKSPYVIHYYLTEMIFVSTIETQGQLTGVDFVRTGVTHTLFFFC